MWPKQEVLKQVFERRSLATQYVPPKRRAKGCRAAKERQKRDYRRPMSRW